MAPIFLAIVLSFKWTWTMTMTNEHLGPPGDNSSLMVRAILNEIVISNLTMGGLGNETSMNSTNLQLKKKIILLGNLITDCFQLNKSHSFFSTSNYTDDGPWCPKVFDGFACWDRTPASVTAYRQCPEFIFGFDPKRFAYKTCTPDGVWFSPPNVTRLWTDYNTCVDMKDLQFRTSVNKIYVIGYIVSFATLVLSIIIFKIYRTLTCTRIDIHVNLFIALAANNILWVIWYHSVVDDVQVVQNNKIWCQLLHVITNYFMVTCYSWMFCEGLHLHIALVVVFFRDEVALRWLNIIGWGLPILIVGTYSIVRLLTPGATDRCWMEESHATLIMSIPVLVSLVTSFVFLMNIVRILLTKPNPATPNQNTDAAKKAARAAFLLIPLFGQQYILFLFQPAPDSPYEHIYQQIAAYVTSFQGLCVSVIFCLTNREVISVTKTHLMNFCHPQINEAIPMTGVTTRESVAQVQIVEHVV